MKTVRFEKTITIPAVKKCAIVATLTDGTNSIRSFTTGDLCKDWIAENCDKIKTIKLSSGTGIFENTNELFRDCTEVTSIDLSAFNASDITSVTDMFYGCNQAAVVICRNESDLDTFSNDHNSADEGITFMIANN